MKKSNINNAFAFVYIKEQNKNATVSEKNVRINLWVSVKESTKGKCEIYLVHLFNNILKYKLIGHTSLIHR